jgi:hypothetical protein
VSLETAAVGPWASRALSHNGHPIPRNLPQRCFQTERPAYRQDQRVRVHDMTRASNQPGSQGKAGKRHTGGCQPESWGKRYMYCMLHVMHLTSHFHACAPDGTPRLRTALSRIGHVERRRRTEMVDVNDRGLGSEGTNY